ncbi:MAG: hypothetical protein OXD36_12445 [Rhodobacter sp.]|nr:hypothetical protein [Rhodobacter sp.]
MRISKFMLPALTVAGALALAGCGGSDSMPDAGPGADTFDADTTSGADFSAAKLPPTATGISATAANQAATRVAKGTHEVAGSNVSVKCENDAGCLYRVTAGAGIEVTGGATVVLTATIGVPAPSAAQPDGNWLSGPSLAGAVPTTGSNGPLAVTVNGVKRTFPVSQAAPETGSGALAGTGLASLWLHESRNTNEADFLVWGTWIDAATPAVPSPKPKQTFGGSIAHGKPTATTGTATYTGAAHGHASGAGITSAADKAWTGVVQLNANFNTQEVTGKIAHDSTAIAATTPATPLITGVNSIQLKKATIGDSLGGKATITGLGDPIPLNEWSGRTTKPHTRNAPSDGTWAGAFYGPTTGDPTGIAGSFSVSRDAAPVTSGADHVPGKWHDPVGALSVSGAFGAGTCTGSGGISC